MSITGLTLDTETPFVSKQDKGDEPTVFRIGTLDSRIQGVLRDRATRILVDHANPDAEAGVQMNGNQFAFEVCQHGIKGWANFCRESGEAIPYRTVKATVGSKSYSVVDPQVLKCIPEAILREISEAIQHANVLNDEAGNV